MASALRVRKPDRGKSPTTPDARYAFPRAPRILYPDAFPEDLRPAVREFYSRCYHQAPTDARLGRLIATAKRVPPA